MERSNVLASIYDIGIVPVVRTGSADTAFRCVEALLRGGIHAAEIPMTVPGAVDVLGHAAERFGDDMVLGAGTVLDAKSARACLLAGAQFLVAPCLRLETVEMARRYSRVVMPGALTPTEVLAAWEAGADAVRIVPCDAMGGVKYIRSLRAPFPHIDMIATGGVSVENVGEFLRAGAKAVGVSGALIDSASLRDGHYEVFTVRAKRFVEAIQRAREAMHHNHLTG
ncbi:MAG TPA: bifunctional 4-hydroxy-2-oxoglutarate aldolase/2-dehydro-3-deoxy-phosphogluconate aldolase [Bryobacteraceae bacterium]|nr:bifunctional 4-hydroxy-2-oxoglutarate aldolase/2-dehydro-3-deoxy-phosphogluconate aldolase [Bryobacteraceae bacterium]